MQRHLEETRKVALDNAFDSVIDATCKARLNDLMREHEERTAQLFEKMRGIKESKRSFNTVALAGAALVLAAVGTIVYVATRS